MTHILRAVAPRNSGRRAEAQAAIIDAIAPDYIDTLAEFGIDTPLRVQHFTAQIAHESDGFCTTEEYASGAGYEGRRDLGNVFPGDGRRFKGRGLIQLTGRYNYGWAGEKLGIDLISNPDLAAEPRLSLRIACLYWQDRGLSLYADRDDIRTITRKINGGLNGLADRERYLVRAKDWAAKNETMTFVPKKPSPRLLEAIRRFFGMNT